MKIRLDNINIESNSGPNSFAKKLMKYFQKNGSTLVHNDYDAALCFIENISNLPKKNLFQRLDGIYFNTQKDYNQQNKNILNTYKNTDGVIFQTFFNKKMTESFFGKHENSIIIHNGADLELISEIDPIKNEVLNNFDDIWCCAADWRPHKRLKDNIDYFLEHKKENDCLVIAGKPDYYIKHPNILYAGIINSKELISLYKKSKYFLHLAWLDHCPNVVVDARASGCKIICSNSGGTKEIAGLNAVLIEEEEWDYKPLELYKPPKLNFSKKINNTFDSCYNMEEISKQYINFMGVK